MAVRLKPPVDRVDFVCRTTILLIVVIMRLRAVVVGEGGDQKWMSRQGQWVIGHFVLTPDT